MTCALVTGIGGEVLLRWVSLAWMLSVPAAPLAPDAARIRQSQPPVRFDQSLRDLERSQPLRFDADSRERLDQLERSGVITPRERQLRDSGKALQPINVSAFQKACRDGALSKQECTSGVARRPGARAPLPRVALKGRSSSAASADRRQSLLNPSTTPLTVPVSALLVGEGGSFRLESIFAVTPRPLPSPGNGDRRLLFPVIGQSFTSSGFGWRLHPVLGSWLMHAGRDFAAPEGAPVVASLSGRVVSSGLAGGYGIAVVLEHQKPLQRTLYGHLSEIYVKAGQSVRQGEVIGRVGSTGLSTGPHLHFELRRPSGNGWIATDPKDLDLGPLVRDMAQGGGDAVSVLMAELLRSLERPETISSNPPAG